MNTSASLRPRVWPRVFPSSGWTSRDVLRQCFKHRGLIIATTLLVTAFVWALLAWQPKIWEATATVWVRDPQAGLPAFLAGAAAPEVASERRIETERALLRSRDSARRIVQGLEIRPEQLQVAPLERLRRGLAASFHRPGAAGSVHGSEAVALQEARLVDDLLAGLQVDAQRATGAGAGSDLIALRFAATDPEIVLPVLQAFLDDYRLLSSRARHQSLDSLLALLETRTREARDDLQASERRWQTFRAAEAALPGRSVPARSAAATSRAAAGPLTSTPLAPATSATATQATSRDRELQRRLDQLRQLYREEAQSNQALSHAIQQLQARQRAAVLASAAAQSEATVLERQRALAQARWEELRQRTDQIDLYLGVHPDAADARVVTEQSARALAADTWTPRLLALLAPLLGLLLGGLLSALRERLDPRLQTPEDAERFLGQRVLAVLPSLPVERVPADTWDGAAVTPGAPNDDGGREEALPPPGQVAPGRTLEALFESNRINAVRAGDAAARDLLVHGLAQRVRDLLGATSIVPPDDRETTTGRVLLVTSARPGEGKSCVARALAKRLAVQDGGKILLIDANAQAPADQGAADAGDATETGFFDLLRDKHARATVVRSRRFRRLHTLTAGTRRDTRDLFHESALAELFERMRARYAWTVVDAGVLAQTGGLQSFADGVVVVVDATRTRREVVRGSLDRAGVPAERMLGIVLNRRPHYVPGWLYRAWL